MKVGVRGKGRDREIDVLYFAAAAAAAAADPEGHFVLYDQHGKSCSASILGGRTDHATLGYRRFCR